MGKCYNEFRIFFGLHERNAKYLNKYQQIRTHIDSMTEKTK